MKPANPVYHSARISYLLSLSVRCIVYIVRNDPPMYPIRSLYTNITTHFLGAFTLVKKINKHSLLQAQILMNKTAMKKKKEK